MMGLGWQELAIVLLIIVVIFGAGKLPEVGSALGRGIKEFKTQASREDEKVPSGSPTTTTIAIREHEPVVEKREVRPEEV